MMTTKSKLNTQSWRQTAIGWSGFDFAEAWISGAIGWELPGRVFPRRAVLFDLRLIRSLEVLEHINNKEARALLQTLSEGAPRAWLTLEAKRMLQRMMAHN